MADEPRRLTPALLTRRWTLPKTRAKNREGRCYELAAKALLFYLPADTTWRLVHGIVAELDGGRTGHAWLVRNNLIWDAVEDRFYGLRDDYLASHRGEVIAEYNQHEASAETLRSNTYGPWDDRLIALLPHDMPTRRGRQRTP